MTKQKPIAWVTQDVCESQFMPSTMLPRKIWWECEKNIGFPIYAAPPKREWVGLTDEEIKGILDCRRGGLVDIKKAEQFLKDKNT